MRSNCPSSKATPLGLETGVPHGREATQAGQDSGSLTQCAMGDEVHTIQPLHTDRQWWGASDASASEDGEAYIGGWITNLQDPRKEEVLWFHLRVNQDWAPWAFKEGSSMKRIAARELFGTLLLVRSLTERKEDPACRTISCGDDATRPNLAQSSPAQSKPAFLNAERNRSSVHLPDLNSLGMVSIRSKASARRPSSCASCKMCVRTRTRGLRRQPRVRVCNLSKPEVYVQTLLF